MVTFFTCDFCTHWSPLLHKNLNKIGTSRFLKKLRLHNSPTTDVKIGLPTPEQNLIKNVRIDFDKIAILKRLPSNYDFFKNRSTCLKLQSTEQTSYGYHFIKPFSLDSKHPETDSQPNSTCEWHSRKKSSCNRCWTFRLKKQFFF